MTPKERAERLALDMGHYNPENWPHFDDLIEDIRQAEAAAREEERFDCWEEAAEMSLILSHNELKEWLEEQLQEAVRARAGGKAA